MVNFTGNSDADGVYLLQRVQERFPRRAGYLRDSLGVSGPAFCGRHIAVDDLLVDFFFDPDTLEELKRLPMVQPSGEYNVYNKVTLSAGTGH